jgi:hypothetical protein
VPVVDPVAAHASEDISEGPRRRPRTAEEPEVSELWFFSTDEHERHTYMIVVLKPVFRLMPVVTRRCRIRKKQRSRIVEINFGLTYAIVR